MELELALAQVLALVLGPAKATEAITEAGPEGDRVVTAPKAVAVQAEEVAQMAEEGEVAAAMGRRRAMGPQAAQVKVRFYMI